MLKKLNIFFFPFLHMIKSPMTLGVRVIAVNTKGEVALLRHTYVDGWHLPGGGIDRGENGIDAALRELHEETGIVGDLKPQLFGFYFNRRVKRDYIAIYRVSGITQEITKKPDHEIAEVGFFAPDALPEGTTMPTRKRIAEAFHGADIASEWWS